MSLDCELETEYSGYWCVLVANVNSTLQVFFDICERHIQRAMEELKSRKREEGEDKTLLELFTGPILLLIVLDD